MAQQIYATSIRPVSQGNPVGVVGVNRPKVPNKSLIKDIMMSKQVAEPAAHNFMTEATPPRRNAFQGNRRTAENVKSDQFDPQARRIKQQAAGKVF